MAPPDSPIMSAEEDTADPLLGGADALRPKAEDKDELREAGPTARAQVDGEDIPDGLIGEDDLHVGTNVWRGAE